MFKQRLLVLAVTLASAVAIGQELEKNEGVAVNTTQVESVTIVGSKTEAREVAGSADYVDSIQLQNEAITDINQVLKTVPGVYIHEEDGYGLRPNIGIRGATAERSEKITLMEDGVLIAPAPYSAPSAYYFPTAQRMTGIEVLKGAPLLREGPQTTGGVINMISTPIPNAAEGTAQFMVNQRGSMDLLLNYGATENTASGQWGYVLEAVQRDYEGYKNIDRTSQDAGFQISDYIAKVSWQNERNLVLLKMQYSEETSDETYLGLTDVDFKADANRRYGLSKIDQMENDHTGINLTHNFKWSEAINTTATVYHNEFNRDWFKLSDGGDFVDDANGLNGAVAQTQAQGVLDGTMDQNNLKYKHNNREYISQGIQFNLNWQLGAHDLNSGIRVHHDEVDRYQPTEVYNQTNGQLVYIGTTQPSASGSDNRLEEANAVSFWLIDNYQVSDDLLLNFSARYEDIDTKGKRWSDQTARNVIISTNENTTEEWLLGVAGTYNITNQWQVLAGFHQGMAPLGGSANESEDPETSENFEAGFRFNQASLFIEAIAFHSNFSNKITYCSVANPCGAQTSGSIQTAAADISGLEFQAGDIFKTDRFSLPLTYTYTFTQAEYSKDDAVNSIQKGDHLKDVPESVMSLRFGLEHESSGWNNYLVAKYGDAICTVAGCNRTKGDFEETESLFTLDVISRYSLSSGPELFLKLENVLDEQAIVARNPDGTRPNMPFTATAGVRYDF